MSKKTSILFIAITLGLAWAMRGHFGHEWGASWAGAMGVLAVLLVAKRKDWAQNAPVLTALGAIGWGAGGMMSYGIVIGYSRSVSFPNALYGYAMLAVIGSLYGFLGGGLFGLGLEKEEKHKPDWPRLIVEMFAGGFLAWGLLIYQMEWLMTPPRSELWAACLGAALALTWYLARNHFHRALHVAAYSALGAGFGFAFGNFIQTLGSTSGIAYNWWNVMEFTLGFFGGIGMGYAVLTRTWPETAKATKTVNRIALVFVFLLIPFTNWINAMSLEKFTRTAERLDLQNPHLFATNHLVAAGISLIVFFVLAVWVWKTCSPNKTLECGIPALLFLITLEYTLFAYIQLATFRHFNLKHSDTLYIFIVAGLMLVWYFYLNKKESVPPEKDIPETWKRWSIILACLILVLVLIAFISANSHGVLPGSHERF